MAKQEAATTIKLLDGSSVTGWYDDTWQGRDYGTGPCRRVRLIDAEGRKHILHGTSISDTMRRVRIED